MRGTSQEIHILLEGAIMYAVTMFWLRADAVPKEKWDEADQLFKKIMGERFSRAIMRQLPDTSAYEVTIEKIGTPEGAGENWRLFAEFLEITRDVADVHNVQAFRFLRGQVIRQANKVPVVIREFGVAEGDSTIETIDAFVRAEKEYANAQKAQ